MVRILSIAQQKGGVGKSVVTVGLAEALRDDGCRVGIVDLDPQGTSSYHLRGRDLNQPSMAHVLSNEAGVAGQWTVADIMRPTDWKIDLAQSSPGLGTSFAATGLSDLLLLRNRLGKLEEYDFVLVDLPSNLGVVTQNAFIASNGGVIVVVVPEGAVLDALNQLFRTQSEIRDELNPDLIINGVVVNMCDLRATEHRQQLAYLRESIGPLVWEPYVPRRTAITAAQAAGVPLRQWEDQRSARRAWMAFRDLASRIQQK